MALSKRKQPLQIEKWELGGQGHFSCYVSGGPRGPVTDALQRRCFMDWGRLVTVTEIRSVTDKKTWYQSTDHRALWRLPWFPLEVTPSIYTGAPPSIFACLSFRKLPCLSTAQRRVSVSLQERRSSLVLFQNSAFSGQRNTERCRESQRVAASDSEPSTGKSDIR